MKTKTTLLISILFFSIHTFSQQIGNGVAPDLPNFSVSLNSGVYGGLNPVGSTPDVSSQWQHLLVIRHGEPANNHQLQIATSFSENKRLFFRKIAGGIEPSNPAWIELATREENSFIGNQSISGDLGINGTLEVNGGANSFSGFGLSSASKPIDIRPNSQYPYVFNWHQGLTFSAHSAYGGLRFYNQGYPDMYGAGVLVMSITNNSVGIGTTNPTTKLEIEGSSQAGYEIGTFKLKSSTENQFMYFGYDDRYSAGYIQSVKPGTAQQNILLAPVGGNVGIGSTNPDSKLTVKGNIHAEEVKVDLAVPADYVFQKYYTGTSALKADYTLLTLPEIEKFTQANHHLPNVPSAKEIKENGLHLGEMSNILLQKIEELTLYSIEQQKTIEKLEKENESFKKLEVRLVTMEKILESKK